MSKKNVSQESSIRRTKILVESIIACGILGISAYALKGAADRSQVVLPSQYAEDPTADIAVPTEAPDPDAPIFTTVSMPSEAIHSGDLILVNADHSYTQTGQEDLVDINELLNDAGITCFSAFEDGYTILRQVYQPMTAMISDYYNIYQDDTLTIYGSYRSHDFQQYLYDSDLAETGEKESTRVAKPGSSEHECGLAFDLSETVNYDYTGEGDQAWLGENCYHYGLILRYTEEKQPVTKIQPEPWHFRYVGNAHAFYMTKNNLCLEEYIDLLRNNHAYSGEHLIITDEGGSEYEVYWYAADGASETTEVPVPSNLAYDISGNNVDGFIVTIHKNTIPTFTADETQPADNETPADDTSADAPDSENEVSPEDGAPGEPEEEQQ